MILAQNTRRAVQLLDNADCKKVSTHEGLLSLISTMTVGFYDITLQSVFKCSHSSWVLLLCEQWSFLVMDTSSSGHLSNEDSGYYHNYLWNEGTSLIRTVGPLPEVSGMEMCRWTYSHSVVVVCCLQLGSPTSLLGMLCWHHMSASATTKKKSLNTSTACLNCWDVIWLAIH